MHYSKNIHCCPIKSKNGTEIKEGEKAIIDAENNNIVFRLSKDFFKMAEFKKQVQDVI